MFVFLFDTGVLISKYRHAHHPVVESYCKNVRIILCIIICVLGLGRPKKSALNVICGIDVGSAIEKLPAGCTAVAKYATNTQGMYVCYIIFTFYHADKNNFTRPND